MATPCPTSVKLIDFSIELVGPQQTLLRTLGATALRGIIVTDVTDMPDQPQPTRQYTQVNPPGYFDDDLLVVPPPVPARGTNKADYVAGYEAACEQLRKLTEILNMHVNAVAAYKRRDEQMSSDLRRADHRITVLEDSLVSAESAEHAAKLSLEVIEQQLADETEAHSLLKQRFAEAEPTTTRAIRAALQIAHTLKTEFTPEPARRRDIEYQNGVHGAPRQLVCRTADGWTFEFYPRLPADEPNGGELIVIDSNGKHHALHFDGQGVNRIDLLGLRALWDQLHDEYSESFNHLPGSIQQELDPS